MSLTLFMLLGLLFPLTAVAQTSGTVSMKTNVQPGKTIKLKIKTADKKLEIEGLSGKWVNGQYINFTVNEGQSITMRGRVTELTCSNCQLTELTLQDCDELQELTCHINKLKKLDLSGCKIIRVVNCNTNEITEIDAHNRTNLTRLFCAENALETLNIKGCSALLKLYAYTNNLNEIDLSESPKLTDFSCFNNQLNQLDISNNTKLMELYCGNNHIKELNITEHKDLSILYCHSNEIKVLDVKNHENLTELYCVDNQLNELDLTGVHSLMKLDCSDNNLSFLDVTGNLQLNDLGCQGNRLTVLDVANLNSLQGLSCGDNQLTQLQVKNHSILEGLSCEGNLIKELDVTGCNALRVLSCSRNAIRGKAMEKLIMSLPDRHNNVQSGGELDVYCDSAQASHRNVCTIANVEDAKAKAWTAKEFVLGSGNDYKWVVYEGAKSYAVTLAQVQGGTLAVKDNLNNILTDTELNQVGHGTELMVEVTPEPSYKLTKLMVNGVDIFPEMSFFVTAQTEVTAEFQVTSAVSNVVDESATIKAIYNASGVQLQELQHGVNIVVMSNGKVKKIFIK